jgi:hypothetical protein
MAIKLTTVTIDLYSDLEILIQDEEYGFEEFCKSFDTLDRLNIKSGTEWWIDLDALKSHSKLRFADLDLGFTLPIEILETLQKNHLNLEELHYRDDDLASPIAAGGWNKDFRSKITETVTTLVEMRNSHTFHLIAKSRMPPKKHRFSAEYDKMGIRQILVERIFQDLAAAAEAKGVENCLKTITLSERTIVMTEAMATNPDFFSETSWTADTSGRST